MKSKGKKGNRDKTSVEHRFPTVSARTKADVAIEAIRGCEPMSVFIDRWLKVYADSGGIGKTEYDIALLSSITNE